MEWGRAHWCLDRGLSAFVEDHGQPSPAQPVRAQCRCSLVGIPTGRQLNRFWGAPFRGRESTRKWRYVAHLDFDFMREASSSNTHSSSLITLLFCGITREGRHKRRETGGRRAQFRKKRKFEMGRPAAMTKIGEKRIHLVRGRGANMKHRALRLDSGNFSWGSEVCTRKVRVLDVTYNASNNELVRTKTLVKGAIILVDAHPFKDWYEKHYGVKTGVKKGQPAPTEEETKKSDHVQRKLASRQKGRVLEGAIDHQFASGRLFAKVTSRPGQSGRCDGVVLEGPELVFYQKMMAKK
eukprot:scaffold277823_cov45-Attheya_sp.AAC.1